MCACGCACGCRRQGGLCPGRILRWVLPARTIHNKQHTHTHTHAHTRTHTHTHARVQHTQHVHHTWAQEMTCGGYDGKVTAVDFNPKGDRMASAGEPRWAAHSTAQRSAAVLLAGGQGPGSCAVWDARAGVGGMVVAASGHPVSACTAGQPAACLPACQAATRTRCGTSAAAPPAPCPRSPWDTTPPSPARQGRPAARPPVQYPNPPVQYPPHPAGGALQPSANLLPASVTHARPPHASRCLLLPAGVAARRRGLAGDRGQGWAPAGV